MSAVKNRPVMATLGMFIVDTFAFYDGNGDPTGQEIAPQIGGGGTYAAIGARMWLPPSQVGAVIDRGYDFPAEVQESLKIYGEDMWLFRDRNDRETTRSRNTYRAGDRSFEYITPRIQVTPSDFEGTKLERAQILHMISAPSRTADMLAEIDHVIGWLPQVIYEPVEYACVSEELPALKEVLPKVSILSPNAGEALRLLSIPHNPKSLSKLIIEDAAHRFLALGVGAQGAHPEKASVIIRGAELGAYLATHGEDGGYDGQWVQAYWTKEDAHRVVDVTGAGNSFLGGLAAGLNQSGGDLVEACLYGSVSASFILEQQGLPTLSVVDGVELWNGETPTERLRKLKERHQ